MSQDPNHPESSTHHVSSEFSEFARETDVVEETVENGKRVDPADGRSIQEPMMPFTLAEGDDFEISKRIAGPGRRHQAAHLQLRREGRGHGGGRGGQHQAGAEGRNEIRCE